MKDVQTWIPASGRVREIRRLAVLDGGESAVRVLLAVADAVRNDVIPPVGTLVLHPEPAGRAWYGREADDTLALGEDLLAVDPGGRVRVRQTAHDHVVELLAGRGVDTVWIGRDLIDDVQDLTARCEKAGLTVVGPSSSTIHLVEDPPTLRRLATEAGVPVRPQAPDGVSGNHPGPGRHVEVEVVADDAGTVWPLATYDVTVRRKGRPVVTTSGCPGAPAEVLAAIRDAAVRLTTAVGYRGAGTVRFLVTAAGEFFLTGVDTRPRADRALTEEITGIDPVISRLLLAAGAPLVGPAPEPDGHVVEVQLFARDAGKDFTDAPGRVALLSLPSDSGVRVRAGIREGDVVPA
ncbi:MAG: hypothetical protein QG622_2806, partial [Actinomycetota bacterium]|nr:hypothetical protein [Actinomycetota bacterium]